MPARLFPQFPPAAVSNTALLNEFSWGTGVHVLAAQLWRWHLTLAVHRGQVFCQGQVVVKEAFVPVASFPHAQHLVWS